MRTLYLDCGMGAAGDMLTAALMELFPDRGEVLNELNSLGIPHVRFAHSEAVTCGIKGSHISVMVDDEEEESVDHHSHHEHHHSEGEEHHHEHGEHSHHEHHHSHHHVSMGDIEHIIAHLTLPPKVQKDVLAIYQIIAEAEEYCHGVPVEEIHFHEVGAMDAVADITAVCFLLDKLAPDQVIASPVHVGSGHVRCAHGILPVPAPATAYILRDVPIYGGKIDGELCTPTGAALLKHFVQRFDAMPVMKVKAIGYGVGKKDYEVANCVRALLGSSAETQDHVVELKCNVDDMTPESIGFAIERFFEAGALEAYTVPIGMKKSRPGVLMCVMCREQDRDMLVQLIMKHTTTIGLRETMSRRYTMSRTITHEETSLGPVRVKHSEGYGIKRSKYEYEDLARIATEKNMSIADVLNIIDR